MGRNLLETLIGAVVLIIAVGFLIFAYERSAVSTVDGYHIQANFTDVSGIGPGSDVRIGGIKIGVVDQMTLDPKTYEAHITLQIKEHIELPKDSSAAVVSSGLLGDKHIKIEPGGAQAMLDSGDVIRFTQSSISLEELIGKFVFSGGGVDSPVDGGSKEAESGETEESESSNPFSLGL